MLLLILFVIGIIFYGAAYLLNKNDHEDGAGFLFVMTTICVGVAIIILPIIYFSNIGRLATMEASYYANINNYEYTIDKTNGIISITLDTDNSLIPIQGNIEKIDLGKISAERIKELRNEVEYYNNDLLRYKAFDKNILIGFLYPTPSEELKLIKLEGK